MSAYPPPVSLSDRIIVALAERPRSQQELSALLPRVSMDAIGIKLAELRRAMRIVLVDGTWRIRAGSSADQEVERVQKAAAREERARQLEQTSAPAKPAPAAEPAPTPADATAETQRTCTQCGETHPIWDFYAAKNGRGGRRADCKYCTRKASRELAVARKRARDARAMPAALPPVEETPAAAAAPAAEPETPPPPEPAIAAENVVAFPGAKAAPKTIEDLVNRVRGQASARVTPLQHVQVLDPVTGAHSMLLSPDGLRALRDQLAGL